MNLGPPLEDDVSDNLGNPILREPSNNELRPPMGFRRQLSGLADLPRDESCFSLSDNDELACGHRLNVLMIGTGEYTTGYIEGVANKSDKAAGGKHFVVGCA